MLEEVDNPKAVLSSSLAIHAKTYNETLASSVKFSYV